MADVIRKALEEIRITVDPEDAKNFESTALKDVWEVARRMEREQQSRGRTNNMRRVESFLRTFETYASAIDTLCQGFSPMAWVWVRNSLCVMRYRLCC